MDFGLTGKVAIITGGSEGIGKASALRLCEEGAEVAICARRGDVLQKAADEIKAKTGKEVLSMAVDVCNEAQVQELVQKTVDRFGGIDILVNNAGGSRAFPFLEASEETWREDIEIKLFGAIFCSKAVIPYMRKRGGGRIINMTTGGGKAPGQKSVPTSVSRAAGINLTKSMATEYAPENILVNTICLGLLKSMQHERRYEQQKKEQPDLTLDAWYDELSKRVPVGRVGEAEEVGDLVAFLSSSRAAFITGTSINIDGGACAVD